MRRLLLALAPLGVVISSCAMGGAGPPVAQAPAKPIDAGRFYSGVWHELARNPMKLTDGCVAGITAFSRDDNGRLIDRDSCRMGDPETGKEKVFAGPVAILDPGTNAKFMTHYKVWGLITVNRTYWVLDHDDAYSWFVVVTPDLKNGSVFARDPQLPAVARDRVVDRLKALGFAAPLEFPAQPSR